MTKNNKINIIHFSTTLDRKASAVNIVNFMIYRIPGFLAVKLFGSSLLDKSFNPLWFCNNFKETRLERPLSEGKPSNCFKSVTIERGFSL